MKLPKIKFRSPEKNPIVILHSDDNWLRRLVLQDLAATTLDTFPAKIHLSPSVIGRTLLRLLTGKRAKSSGTAPDRGFLRDVYDQYLLACLDQTGARVVVTFTDNSGIFRRLSRVDTQRTYFAIQNGTRSLACVRDSMAYPPHLPPIEMTNFFCFGKRDVELFTGYGHRIDRFDPVGSLIGGYYKSVIAPGEQPREFDLCLISQWYAELYTETSGDDFTARVTRRVAVAVTRLNEFIARLLQETGLTLVVCPRHDRDSAEVQFYRDAFGDRVKIEKSDRGNFSTYRAIGRSRLAIAVNSTTLAEVFSWGQKVLWCNVPHDDHFEMPEAGISYFSGDDFESFKQRVLDLLHMPQREYEDRTRTGAQYICNFDRANPPHVVIRRAIVKAQSGNSGFPAKDECSTINQY